MFENLTSLDSFINNKEYQLNGKSIIDDYNFQFIYIRKKIEKFLHYFSTDYL